MVHFIRFQVKFQKITTTVPVRVISSDVRMRPQNLLANSSTTFLSVNCYTDAPQNS